MTPDTKLPSGVGLLLSLLEAETVNHERMAQETIDDIMDLMRYSLARDMCVAATSAAIAVLHHPETQQEDFLFVIGNLGRLKSANVMQAAREILETQRKNG